MYCCGKDVELGIGGIYHHTRLAYILGATPDCANDHLISIHPRGDVMTPTCVSYYHITRLGISE